MSRKEAQNALKKKSKKQIHQDCISFTVEFRL